MTRNRHLFATSLSGVVLLGVGAAQATTPIAFSGATATFHQTFDRNWDPSEMIDGITSGRNGWAIYRANGAADQTQSETALFTAATPLTGGPTALTFTIYQNYGSGPSAFHLLGDFSLAYTTDAAPTLASAQTALTLTGESSLNGTTFTSSAPGQLLAGGSLPETDVYTITAYVNSASPITGFFLNAINDPASGLPTGGPGRQPSNGNFVVNEFTASAGPAVRAVPEPTTWAMMLIGMAGIGAVIRRRGMGALV